MIKFNEKYRTDVFMQFLQGFLPADFVEKEEDIIIDKNRYKQITNAKILGYCESLDLYVLEMDHNCEKDPRVAIATDAFKILADHWIHRSLIIFKNKESDNYRLSYLTISLDINDKNKIIKKYSNARRYSFYLGVNAKVKTPEQQLIEKGRVKDINDLFNRFSVEVVNKQFYLEVAKYFDELVLNLSLPGISKENVNVKKSFAVRLIGRLMFCWFLKQKKSDSGQLVPDGILSSTAVSNNYYHEVLEPLFFEVLNTNINDRGIRSDLFDKVPYLNGGLFNPQAEDFYELDKGTFSSKFINTLQIKDSWFKEFFDLLEMYNFTIDENTVFDQELSVDPEMLGRIFENLLAEINPETGNSERKRTGSFYTPRQIVEYMVDQSLIEYLKTKTEIDEKKISALVSYDLTDDTKYPLEESDKKEIVNAIESLKILDPACGSGAYPIGALQKIVYILQVVDFNGTLWRAKKLENVPELYRKKIEDEFSSQTLDYIRKLEVIRNSIFGVDIQPIAVEVSRLRCFLTLVVESEIDDKKPNRGIEPLPNLDFKFVCANTLISLPKKESTGLFDDHSGITELSKIMSEYFSCNSQKKNEIKLKFLHVQKEILEKTISAFGKNTGELTLKLTTWNPFGNTSSLWFDLEWMFGVEDGFDIVIGNPPYVQIQKFSGQDIQKQYANANYQTFQKMGDIYALFYERGLEVLKKETGLLCYITSNKWMRAGYGESLRKYFSKKNPLRLLDFGGFKVFESATVDTNILLIQNTDNKNKLQAVHFKNDFKKGEEITKYFNENKTKLKNLSSDTWFIGSNAEINLKKKIEEKGLPLKDWDIKINYGIKTGYNEAFIIDKKTRNELIMSDAKSEEIIKPILRGRDIKKYGYKFADKWIIATLPVLELNIDNYPAIKKYLLSFGKRLEQTGNKGCRKKTGNKWFETQDQISYYKEFEKEKIVWGNIAYESSFCFSHPNEYINAPANILTSENVNLKFLLGCMNSKIFNYEFSNSGIDLGKAFEWKKQYVEKIHIPKITSQNKIIADKIVNFVDQILEKKKDNMEADTVELEREIDGMVYELYELGEEEIGIVEGKV